MARSEARFALVTHARKALAQAPDEPNRQGIQNLIKQIEEGK